MLEFIQDKCDLLDSFQVEQNVKVGINIKGREWVNPEGQTKYFNSIQGWRIENINSAQSEIPPLPSESGFEPSSSEDNEVEDDLPF